MTGTQKPSYTITSLQRGLHLLQLISRSERGLTATQVTRLPGIPFSTVHRFLVNLESSGFLQASAGATGVSTPLKDDQDVDQEGLGEA